MGASSLLVRMVRSAAGGDYKCVVYRLCVKRGLLGVRGAAVAGGQATRTGDACLPLLAFAALREEWLYLVRTGDLKHSLCGVAAAANKMVLPTLKFSVYGRRRAFWASNVGAAMVAQVAWAGGGRGRR